MPFMLFLKAWLFGCLNSYLLYFLALATTGSKVSPFFIIGVPVGCAIGGIFGSLFTKEKQ